MRVERGLRINNVRRVDEFVRHNLPHSFLQPATLVSFIGENHPISPEDRVRLYNELAPIINGEAGTVASSVAVTVASSVAATHGSDATPDLSAGEMRTMMEESSIEGP